MTDDAVTKSSRPNEKVGFAWTGTGVNTFFGLLRKNRCFLVDEARWVRYKNRQTVGLCVRLSARDYSANGEEYIALCPCGQRGRSRSAVANSSKFSDYAHESRTRASQSSIEFYSLVAGCCLFRAQVW